MNHLLFYKSQQAVCPKCGGLITTLKSDEIIVHCIDCDTYFRAIGEGKAESELTFEEAELKC